MFEGGGEEARERGSGLLRGRAREYGEGGRGAAHLQRRHRLKVHGKDKRAAALSHGDLLDCPPDPRVHALPLWRERSEEGERDRVSLCVSECACM